MNIQEREQLVNFLQQLDQASAGVKDAEAQMLIASTLARQPDAGYLLVQRSLLQDNALQAAQAQIVNLQAELQQAKQGTTSPGFLDANAWGRAPVAPSYPQATPAVQAPAQPYPQAPVAAAPGRFQAPSFLTSMATTAAGVAAGAFLFQGIENLMGHHGGGPAAASQALGGAGDLASGSAAGTSAAAFGLSDPATASASSDSAAFEKNSFSSNAVPEGDAFSADDGLDFGADDSSDWA